MRTPEDIVHDYRQRGYTEERIRALANSRPEPVRGQILALIDAEASDAAAPAEPEAEAAIPAGVGEEADDLELDFEDDASVEIVLEADDSPAEATAVEPEVDVLATIAAEEETVANADDGEAPAAAEKSSMIIQLVPDAEEDEETASTEETVAAVAPAVTDDDLAEAMLDTADEPAVAKADMVIQLVPDPEEEDQDRNADHTAQDASTDIEAPEAPAAVEEDEEILDLGHDDLVAETVAETLSTETEATGEEDANETEPVAATAPISDVFVEIVPPAPVSETVEAPVEETTRPLTEISVETMTQSEFFRVRPAVEAEEEPMELIDLRTDVDGESDFILIDAMDADAETDDATDPVASECEEDTIVEKEDCVIVFDEEVESAVLADLRSNKAAARSFKVLQNAIASGEEALEEANKIIALNPPYALPSDGDDIPMNAEESALIRFPEEMEATYFAIQDSRNLSKAKAEQAEIAFEEDESERVVTETPAAPSPYTDSDYLRIEEEIASLRNMLVEVEDALKLKDMETETLERLVQERDETLSLQSDELDQLRQARQADSGNDTAPHAWEDELVAAEQRAASAEEACQAMDREFNVLATETVPNLMKDKEDLVAMLENQENEKLALQEHLDTAGRRVAFGYTFASAAMVLVVAMPVLHFFFGRSAAPVAEDNRIALAQAALENEQQRRIEVERDKAALALTVESMQQARKEDRARLVALKEKFTTQIERLRREQEQAHLALGGATTETPSTEAVALENRRIGIGEETGEHLHRNTIRDLPRNWTTHRQRTERSTDAQDYPKSAKVKRGDRGLDDVLYRVYGRSGKHLRDAVAKINGLKRNSNGFLVIHPEQVLRLPKNPDAVALAE